MTDIGKQTITFFATNNYNPIFNPLKLCGSCSGIQQYGGRAFSQKRWPDVVLRFRKKEEKCFFRKKYEKNIYQCQQNVNNRRINILKTKNQAKKGPKKIKITINVLQETTKIQKTEKHIKLKKIQDEKQNKNNKNDEKKNKKVSPL